MVDNAQKLLSEKRHTAREGDLTALFNILRDMAEQQARHQAAFEIHMKTEEDQRREFIKTIEDQRHEFIAADIAVRHEIEKLSLKIDEALELKEAFPSIDGKPDTAGHKADHLTRMEADNRSKNFRNKLKEDLTSTIIKSILIFVFVVFLMGFKEWLVNYINHPVDATKNLILKE
jgi:hypothetical protein